MSDDNKSAHQAWSEVYKKAEGDGKAIDEHELASANALNEVLQAATPGSGYEMLQQHYKESAAAEAEGKEKTRREVLSDDELKEIPAEAREEVSAIYNHYLSDVFETVGVKVTPKDEEWMYIQAEIEDPASSLVLTMIAAREAADRKKQRLQGQTRNQVWEEARKEYKK